jgi:hypothetical protein
MENIRALMVGTLSALAAYLSPIYSVIFSILYVFLMNFALGYLTGMVHGERFCWRKAFSTIREVMVYYLLLVSIFIVGERMGDRGAALQAITTVTYAFIYFYAVNILRNLSYIFKDSRSINFIYYVISFEVIKKIPFMESFVKNEKGKEGGHEAEAGKE